MITVLGESHLPCARGYIPCVAAVRTGFQGIGLIVICGVPRDCAAAAHIINRSLNAGEDIALHCLIDDTGGVQDGGEGALRHLSPVIAANGHALGMELLDLLLQLRDIEIPDAHSRSGSQIVERAGLTGLAVAENIR